MLTGENPCRKVRRFDEDNRRTRILLREEEKRLLERLVGKRAHLRPIVQLAIHTMLRRSELLSLRKENLDFERDLILVTNAGEQKTKSKKSRLVPINSAARQILLGLCRASATAYVFPNKKTGRYIKDVKTAFTAACEDAKINDLRFHDLRRTGATRLGEGGADAFYIAAILGHADVNTSQVYTVATNASLRRAMEALTLMPVQADAIVPHKRNGRRHRRPFLAAVGYVVRVGESALGGNTVFVAGAGGRHYYYAHLDSYAPTLAVGDYVTAETVLGYVGTTGNAAGASPHLHFGVYTPGRVVDPLPLLTDRPIPEMFLSQ